MKLKIPPAIQVLLFAALMWVIRMLTDVKHVEFEYQEIVSWLVFSIGVVMGVIAVFAFRKASTTVDLIKPAKASQLVITGIYKFTRNPMYLGMFFILIAFAIRLGSFYSLPVLAIYVWYITTFQIKPEEEVLTELFKDDFISYRKSVNRWI